jgi:hypothetical protein
MRRGLLVILFSTGRVVCLTWFPVRLAGAIISPSDWVGGLTRAIDDRKRRMEEYASLVHKGSECLLTVPVAESCLPVDLTRSHADVHQDLKDVLERLEVFSEYVSEAEVKRNGMSWSSSVPETKGFQKKKKKKKT